MSSPRAIESLLAQHQVLLLSLGLPDLLSASTATSVPPDIPYVAHLELIAVANELPTIRKNLQKYTKHRKYGQLVATASQVQNQVDEYIFVNNRFLDRYDSEHALPPPQLATETQQNDNHSADLSPQNPDDNLGLLRQRLLAGGTHTSFDDATDVTRANEYHESIQEDIMSELTGLASSLRTSAINFSAKLLDDTKALDRTSDAMFKNETLMRQVGSNLNNYVTNKTGGKILFWFLLKVSVGIYVLFFAMVLIVKIFPKL